MDLIIAGGTVITETDEVRADVGIVGGVIKEIGNLANRPSTGRLDATGLLVLPGGVDVHVHISLPFGGTTSSDDFQSGSRAAAFGGTTTMINFASQAEGISLPEAVSACKARADGESVIDYALHIIVNDVSVEALEQLEDVVAEGVTTFKAFTAYPNEGLMLSASNLKTLMTRASDLGAQVDVHAEEGQRVEALRESFLQQGRTSMLFHPKSRPPQTEADAVRRVLELASATGCDTHFHHISTQLGLEIIREFGTAQISAETCPQYLLLDEEVYSGPDASLFAVSPPLRSPADREALWSALAEELVSIVATDHCPFTRAQKNAADGVFHRVPNGIPGIETRLPLLHSEGVVKRGFSLPLFTRLVATNPSRRFGLYPKKGTIRPGSDADIVLFDPKRRVTVTHSKLHMNCDWSPFEGYEVLGWPRVTLIRGEVICAEGELQAEGGCGEFIARPTSAEPKEVSE